MQAILLSASVLWSKTTHVSTGFGRNDVVSDRLFSITPAKALAPPRVLRWSLRGMIHVVISEKEPQTLFEPTLFDRSSAAHIDIPQDSKSRRKISPEHFLLHPEHFLLQT